jgi:DNA invertase Pin-like site-specific DNA recombinase
MPLRRRGIDVRIANFNLDITTPMRRFVFTMMSALPEFERSTLSRRTKEGIAAERSVEQA